MTNRDLKASDSILGALRTALHGSICANVLGKKRGVFNNADKDNKASVLIAHGLAERVGSEFCASSNLPSAQASGTQFAEHLVAYIAESLRLLNHIRPGKWTVASTQRPITAYDQYAHLAILSKVAREHPEVRVALGGDYLVKPDIVVLREPLSLQEINATASLIGGDTRIASLSPLLADVTKHSTLHASVSCKWTMRSDRAQNTRTEALNLLRNRKGRSPVMAVVTAEPLPSRIASIAEGTGDVDCTYHFALYELFDVVKEDKRLAKYAEALSRLIDGRRLRDVSDLPLDLCI